MLPLAIQCHHAVCDGYHVGKFVEALRSMAANPKQWL
ncbi:CatA-like O-acetyltransferase [Desulfitobacterium hafniense]|uniref:Chloramphenicol acetyltransferase n=1 Tax=Desulfitobacterium hafniense TaxID=49338 RepID=A0A098AUF8_DESHA|nr:CatA-like O-acetyltransferase [Desulfitobacterium hafniense]WRS28361.1 CatA-like O-acetyltransferase [Oscillospiraceae bacterium MB08-C2-2]CDX00004.1 Chloramphenicol acetyltransferase [Desulfitobacterium hafniense]